MIRIYDQFLVFLQRITDLNTFQHIRENIKTVDNDLVEIQKEELFFPPSDVLQLKSYYLSSSVQVGAKPAAIAAKAITPMIFFPMFLFNYN